MARIRTLVTGFAFIAVAAVAAPALPAQAVPLSDFGKKPKVYIVKDSMRGYDSTLGLRGRGLTSSSPPTTRLMASPSASRAR